MSNVCPNGHPFPRAVTVGCEHCRASVVCVPHSDAIRLHEALERAEREAMDSQARVARLQEALQEVASAGAQFDDESVDCVVVKIDRPTWDALRAR
jgi:hypothetical protein